MFAENIFANQNLSAKFAKIFSRENFPLYGMYIWYDFKVCVHVRICVDLIQGHPN